MSDAGEKPPHLGPTEVRDALTMRAAIDAVGAALGSPEFEQPPRLVLDDGRLLVMVATHRGTGHSVVKSVNVRVEGTGSTPTVDGLLVWIDGQSGRGTFTADGGAVTALRTGAVSGLATDLLAPADARHLAMLGAGRQATAQVEAVCAVRPIEQVTVFSRTPAHAHAFARGVADRMPHLEVRTVAQADDAVSSADVVCCATGATEPLFKAQSLSESVHVNAIGSYRAHMRELPVELLMSASVVAVDDLAGCLDESGELIDAVRAGLDPSSLRALGPLAAHRPERVGRTVFKSVGCAVLDWAVASALTSALAPRPAPRPT